MKVVVRSSSPLLSFLGKKPVAEAPPTSTLLRRGAAGPVRIGMSPVELLAEFGRRIKFDRVSGKAVVFPAHDSRRPELSIGITEENVIAIWVYSSRYQTESGVGPGGSVISLANAHQIYWVDDDSAKVDDLNMMFRCKKDRIAAVLVL